MIYLFLVCMSFLLGLSFVFLWFPAMLFDKPEWLD
jgi:hypothetical protein